MRIFATIPKFATIYSGIISGGIYHVFQNY